MVRVKSSADVNVLVSQTSSPLISDGQSRKGGRHRGAQLALTARFPQPTACSVSVKSTVSTPIASAFGDAMS